MKLVLIFTLVIIFIIFIIDKVINFSINNNDILINNNISVIILNYNRPENIKVIVNKLLEYKINEIIITNGKKETEVIFNNENIINETKLRNKYYCATRYELLKYAKNDIILFLDDDFYPSIKLLNSMLHNYNKYGINNHYTCLRRTCDKNGYNTFKSKYNNIGLIGLSLVNKNTAMNIWNEMKISPYFKIVMEQKGNCEDLLFAFLINKNGGKSIYSNIKPYSIKNNDGYHSNKNHYEVRSNFCKKINTI